MWLVLPLWVCNREAVVATGRWTDARERTHMQPEESSLSKDQTTPWMRFVKWWIRLIWNNDQAQTERLEQAWQKPVASYGALVRTRTHMSSSHLLTETLVRHKASGVDVSGSKPLSSWRGPWESSPGSPFCAYSPGRLSKVRRTCWWGSGESAGVRASGGAPHRLLSDWEQLFFTVTTLALPSFTPLGPRVGSQFAHIPATILVLLGPCLQCLVTTSRAHRHAAVDISGGDGLTHHYLLSCQAHSLSSPIWPWSLRNCPLTCAMPSSICLLCIGKVE